MFFFIRFIVASCNLCFVNILLQEILFIKQFCFLFQFYCRVNSKQKSRGVISFWSFNLASSNSFTVKIYEIRLFIIIRRDFVFKNFERWPCSLKMKFLAERLKKGHLKLQWKNMIYFVYEYPFYPLNSATQSNNLKPQLPRF